MVLGTPAMAAFGVLNLLKGNHLLAAMITMLMVGVMAGWWMLLRLTNGRVVYRLMAGLYFTLVLYMVALSDQDGSKILWVYTFPLITFFILGQREGIFWVSCLFIAVMILLLVPPGWLRPYPYHGDFKLRFVATFSIVTAITYWLEHFRHRYREALRKEHRELESEKKLLQTEIEERKRVEQERESLILQLKETLEKVNTLRGLIPICANCHSIRDDKGYWNRLEGYIQMHSDAEFSHSICPGCKKKLYPDFYPDK